MNESIAVVAKLFCLAGFTDTRSQEVYSTDSAQNESLILPSQKLASAVLPLALPLLDCTQLCVSP